MQLTHEDQSRPDLLTEIKNGCIWYPIDNSQFGSPGRVDETATDELLTKAADEIERLMERIAVLRQQHDQRVTELLEANNREVERRRAAEATTLRITGALAAISLTEDDSSTPAADKVRDMGRRARAALRPTTLPDADMLDDLARWWLDDHRLTGDRLRELMAAGLIVPTAYGLTDTGRGLIDDRIKAFHARQDAENAGILGRLRDVMKDDDQPAASPNTEDPT